MKQVIIGVAVIALMVSCKPKTANESLSPSINDSTAITDTTKKDSVVIDTNKSVSTDLIKN